MPTWTVNTDVVKYRAAVVVAIQNWLAESPQAKAAASQPAYMSVGMALLSLFVVSLPPDGYSRSSS
jgi:hypothetical protein